MNICIVGNGESALINKNGDFIDSCDIVVRLGEFQIKSYEPWVGIKTNVYCARWHKSKTRPPSFFNQLKEIWIPRTYETREKEYDNLTYTLKLKQKIHYIPKHLLYMYQIMYPININNLKKCDEQLNCILPDSGIIAIDMALFKYKNENIFVTGFDNCQTGYYWNPGIKLTLQQEVVLNTQKQTLNKYLKTNKIISLDENNSSR